ncbi:MobF family relaxase [Nocardia asteroides]|uniref:MobF family relaxase n=1 Tax=Nocardia asteroides TaxID=1824 RepID=UPI0037CB029F
MMSLSKIGTGEGFRYYLQVVAAQDTERPAGQDLDSYYAAHGESPGVWMGSALAAVGVPAGAPVSEAQLRALIGEGLHPDADVIVAEVVAEQIGLGAKPKDAVRWAMRRVRLGNTYGRFSTEPGGYRHECAVALAAWNTKRGNRSRAAVPAKVRARICRETAEKVFQAETGHAPTAPEELSDWIERAHRPARAAVAGWDLTFSPVKSVSALWALAPAAIAEQIEAAHHRAVAETIEFVERHALHTRVGRNGVNRVRADGLIAARFDHRQSRAGDPDLHSHVVVSNRVHHGDHNWGAADGTILYRYVVTCSELYNSLLEAHLGDVLGLGFAARADATGEYPIREVVGIEESVSRRWSTRRGQVLDDVETRIDRFRADHGRAPTTRERYGLAQQATLATREGKPVARNLAQQRHSWRGEAAAVLGGEAAVDAMVATTVAQRPGTRWAEPVALDIEAARVVNAVTGHRSSWQHPHIYAEAARRLRGRVPVQQWSETVEQLVATALAPPHSVPRRPHEPIALTTVYTSPQVLAAETRLAAARARHDGPGVPANTVTAALEAGVGDDPTLGPDEIEVVALLATSRARLHTATVAAGADIAALQSLLAQVWAGAVGPVIGVGATAAAAAGLHTAIGAPSTTLAEITALAQHAGSGSGLPDWFTGIDERTLVLLDHGALLGSSTVVLDAVVTWLLERGASVRSIGQDRRSRSAVSPPADSAAHQ